MRSEQAPKRAQNRIQVSYRKIAELKPDPNNPRLHSRSQVRRIARSIEGFGFNVPVLIDAAGQIIAGHGRVLACIQLGWDEVPTICLEHLSQAQARAFMLADNRLTEISEWDEQLLAQQFKALAALDLDFELEDTGFDLGEIDLRIDELSSASADYDARANQIPESGQGPAVCGELLISLRISNSPHTGACARSASMSRSSSRSMTRGPTLITPDDLRAHCGAVVEPGAPATAIHVRDIVKTDLV